MNIRLRYKLLSIVFVLAGVFLWGRCGRHSLPTVPNKPATVLPPQDAEQILVDPARHRLTIVKPTGIQVLTLPDRLSTIDIQKNGIVKVTSPQFGFQHHFFGGVQVSDAGRLMLGMDFVYWKKLDLGFGAAEQIGNHIPLACLKLSYNIWSNVQIGVTFDNHQRIGAALTVRL